ncbi:uncharacterized protein LOC131628350 [Vicia villosa]|uniref:uncharacterized protein LOC131628350 n=1 Tax=Vicia villosa TaxID=3911 RepID=UPI00273A8984|nr:uncharacterized protein LOC131628350 [Vicia villosa]
MTYAQVLPYLLDLKLVQLRTLATPAKLPANWDANARCEFHSGAPGHSIDNCKALKHQVQNLLDSKAIEFTPTQGPNVVQNPMPPHGAHAANAIESVEDTRLVKDVIELGSLLPLLKEELLRMGLYSGCGEFCTDCMAISSVCDKVKRGVQQLMDNAYLQFERVRHPEIVENEVNVASIPYILAKIPIPARAPPLVITLPGPVPYNSEKAVPWNYGGEVFYQGAKYEIKIPVEKEDVDNVVGIGRMTRSGRIFNPPQNTRDDNTEAPAQAKGKRVVEDTVDQWKSSNSEDTVAKEMEEFLKIIKKSEYKVVDQLSQTQSKISILQLLLCSETHRNALLRLLSTAFVPPDISVNQLEGVVSNINAGNGLGFTDADLPSEGRNHNRALHISVECKGTMLSRVLVDNGSSFNVLPKSSLMRLDYSGVEIRPSELTVRAFDGSKRSVFGEVDLPIMIGPQLFTITFFVMDIHPSYICLLGRPWIHAAGAVTSTLHQKLKFATQGKIVTICGEEEHMISHLASFRYIEVEGEVHETPCQAFEAVQTIKIPYVENKKLEAPMSSLKEAKVVVESGHPEGWGRVLDLPIKQDKCGIGYQLGQSSSNGAPKKPGTFVPIKFSSAGIVKDHVCAADDDMDSDYDIEEWIKPCVPGQKLLNWSSEDIISIAFDQKSTSPPDSVDNGLAMPRSDFDNPIYIAEEGDEEDYELSDELARLIFRWQMILTEYDIQYTTQKAIKSSVIADYLAHQPVDDYQTMHFEFPDEDIMCVAETSNSQDQEEGPEPGARWTLVFDGASNALGNGIGAVLTSPTGATPFLLVYGMEAILPVEVEIPSLRVLTDVKLSEADWVQTIFDQLNLIDEKRLAAICHGQAYQKKMKKAFDKKIRPRHFQVGDLVLKKILPIHNDPRGKWTPNYEGPYVVKKVFSGGAMILSTMDGEDFPLPVNADAVKKYFT